MTQLFRRNEKGEITRLEPSVAQREQQDLHDLVLANANLLPGSEISPDGKLRWILIGSEVPVPDPEDGKNRWALDILLGDDQATPTLVECKRVASAEIRRELIGQMIEYAANAQHYWDANTVESIANHWHKSSAVVAAAIEACGWRDGTAAYFEAYERKLKEGQFRLVFVVDHAPHRLRSTVEFLNREFDTVEALVVEVRRHVVGNEMVIASGLLGYSEMIRAQKREAAERRGRQRYGDAEFLALLAKSGTSGVQTAGTTLLEESRSRGWSVRYTPFGSILIGLPTVQGHTTIAVVPAKGCALEWYVGEFAAGRPDVAKNLFDLAQKIGSSGASKYPRTSAEVWPAKLQEILAGLQRIESAAADAPKADAPPDDN